MTRILDKQVLAPNIVRMRLEAPRIARKRQAGQFVILRPTTRDERLPLTIAHASAEEGWIEIIFQIVGQGTTSLAELEIGMELSDLVGPLGRPTHIELFGETLCVGGGVGAAPLHPIARALAAAGNRVTTVLGARTSELLLMQDEMREFSAELHLATDDGSVGHHGYVSEVVSKLLAEGRKFDLAVVIGPAPMMRVTSGVTVAAGIPSVVSLNPIMVDGTGMCGGCRVTVGGQTRFACVDGPEFDAAGVDWAELSKRLGSYREFEKRALERHRCNLSESR